MNNHSGADSANQTTDHSFLEGVPSYLFPAELDVGNFDPFTSAFTQDFSTFLDSVPSLASPFSSTHQPLPVLFSDVQTGLRTSTNDSAYNQVHAGMVIPAADTSISNPSATESSLSRYGSRLPSLALEDSREAIHPQARSSTRHQRREFFVSADCRQSLLDQLVDFPGCVAMDFVIPSRHALSRLVGGYFQNFHDHYPFLHAPTLRLELLKPELLLAIAALGARYTREPDIGVELYRVSRAIAMERISRRQVDVFQKPSTIVGKNSNGEGKRKNTTRTHEDVMELMQTLLLLIATSSWYKHEPAAQDALSIRSVLHSITRENGVIKDKHHRQQGWAAWTRMEGMKRTLLVIYCFFNIHTILFDLPPMMLPSELKVDLPCSEREWKASNESEWCDVLEEVGSSDQGFQEAYTSLFASPIDTILDNKGFSALGGYSLIHAIIQQIWLVRNGRMPVYGQGRNVLSDDEMHVFERALKRWTGLWERNRESSMDPLSPHGPLTFTSTALLRLAYIRLNMDLGPARSLNSWDPNIVANSIHHSPGARRGDHMTRAALHCAHALSIPIKLGINYVAQTQVIRWSNQHALCSLECAVLMAKWLEAITADGVSLKAEELTVLEFTAQLVSEGEYKLSYEWILEHKQCLSGLVVRLWAKLYQSKSVWQTVDLIGESLNIYADFLEAGR